MGATLHERGRALSHIVDLSLGARTGLGWFDPDPVIDSLPLIVLGTSWRDYHRSVFRAAPRGHPVSKRSLSLEASFAPESS
jgi:hypothetical protein